MAISGSDILFKYSVTTAEEGSLQPQPTPAASLGGFVSTTTWAGSTKHDLFGAISADANAKLVVEYRCVFLVNTSSTEYWFGPKLWLSASPEATDLAIGIDILPPVARGFDGQQAGKTTGVGITPHGVTFSTPLSQSEGIEVGDLGPGECRALWLRRTAKAATLPVSGDGCTLHTQLKTASVTWDVAASQAAESITDTRCGPFHSVAVDYMVAGTTRVTWRPRQGFPYKTPFSCQLQVGQTGSHTADDWVDVGPASTNSFVFTDPERRSTGKQLTTHYRIKMTDADGVIYYSSPSIVLGSLGPRDWLTFRELARQETLRLKAFAGVTGFLLKRRRNGTPCTRCLDPHTQEATDGKCSVCKGTRFVDGYYRAVPMVFADVSNPELEEQRSQGPEGWSMPSAVKADFVATPHLETGDIWVDGSSDLRYHIDKVVARGRIRGLPVALSAVMSQLAFSHEAYAIPLEGT